jgi:hypothetical protein
MLVSVVHVCYIVCRTTTWNGMTKRLFRMQGETDNVPEVLAMRG